MNNKKVLGIIIFSLIILGAGIFLMLALVGGKKEKAIAPEAAIPQKSLAEVRKEYKTEVVAIMSAYVAERGTINLTFLQGEALATAKKKWLDLVQKTENSLLALKLTAEYQKMHLDLVLGLNFIEQGLKGDSAKTSLGENKINEVLKEYPWLISASQS